MVVPDLRGIGRSSRPAGGYDKKTQAADIRAVVTTLGYDKAALVSHDIGIMVAYAYAARYRDKVERLLSSGPLKEKCHSAGFRTMSSQGAMPGIGAAIIGLTGIAGESIPDPLQIDSFAPLQTMPVLAAGGEKSFGATEAVVMRNGASNVREAVVPGAGHWLKEESPAFTIALIQDFLKDRFSAPGN